MQTHQREVYVAAALILLLTVLAIAAPRFYEPDQLVRLLVKMAPLLVASVGMTLVILARQIDISIGSQVCVCGVVAGLLAKTGVPMPIVVSGAILTGGMFGALNGALIAGLGLPSIVVTLAMLVILRASLRWFQEGELVRDLPASFQWFGAGQTNGQWLVLGIVLVVFLVCAWSLRNLAAGRAIYATGSDPEAAWLAGIRPRLVIFGVFVAMGAFAGLAALLDSVRFVVVDPNAGSGLELRAIAAVVVGGVAISGGRGSLAGTLIGVALLGTIQNALVFLKAETHWEKAIQGLIILGAVALEGMRRKSHT